MTKNNQIFQLVIVGMNYKTSTIFDREIFQINKKEMPEALRYFKSMDDVEGIVIISTCNRVEFYLVINENADPFLLIDKYYYEKKKINSKEKRKLFYLYDQSDVAEHLFHVMAGLDSLVFGEYQIQGQVKEAYSIACSEKTAEKILHKLFHAAFRAGKNIRSKTKIGSGKQSVSGMAYQLIKGKLNIEDPIAIIGVNQSTKIFADNLTQSGFSNLFFVNRTFYKAEELVNKYGGAAFSLDRIEEPLSKSKCIFTCTGAADFIITSELLNKTYTKSNCPELIIDLAIPRDIDTIGLIEEIEVFDLEELKTYLEKQQKEIASDLPLAEKIISDEVGLFEVWSEAQQDDLLAYYAEKIELMRLQLLDESKVNFSEDELSSLDKFSRYLIHRMNAIFNQAVRLNELEEK